MGVSFVHFLFQTEKEPFYQDRLGTKRRESSTQKKNTVFSQMVAALGIKTPR
jgi:hypothetical protein